MYREKKSPSLRHWSILTIGLTTAEAFVRERQLSGDVGNLPNDRECGALRPL